jgi:hypothetical protein
MNSMETKPGACPRTFLVPVLFAAVLALAAHTPRAPQREVTHSLASGISITLPPDWVETTVHEDAPSVLLTASAPQFHFSPMLTLTNLRRYSILKLATSNNLLAGRNAYWLDTQMHAPNDSGTNLPDFLFYFFFSPPHSCLEKGTSAYSGAGRAYAAGSTPPDLQVYLDCQFPPTLADFASAQISSGVILRQSQQSGLRAIGTVNDFYLAPMLQTDFAGTTFYIFEARQPEGLLPQVVQQFNLPQALVGAQADYFWAVGAKTPFPFVNDSAGRDARLIHVAFAGIAVGGGMQNDFLALLHKVRVQ